MPEDVKTLNSELVKLDCRAGVHDLLIHITDDLFSLEPSCITKAL